MFYIYILQLEGNKYYVGKTKNPNIRITEHFNFNGSQWTKKYRPLKVFEVISNCDEYDEDKYTLKYMKKYGIDNVRGGSFCQMKLSNENMNTIKKMLKSSSNKCFNCNSSEHFIKNCPTKENNFYESKVCNNDDDEDMIEEIQEISCFLLKLFFGNKITRYKCPKCKEKFSDKKYYKKHKKKCNGENY